MTKIAILCCSNSWGGLELNMINYSQWLNESYEVLFLGIKDSPIVKTLEQHPIAINYFDEGRRKHLNFSAAKRLAKTLKSFGAEVLLIGHYNQHYTSVISKLYYPQIKLVYMQHMQMMIKRKDFYHHIFYSAIDVWLAPLESLKKQLFENTTLTERQVKIVPLCLDETKFTGLKTTKWEARTKIRLPEGSFLIGNIGRLDKLKGQEFILDALNLLKNEIANVKVVLIGNETSEGSDYGSFLKQKAEGYGLTDTVIFIPHMPNIELAYKALDVFVMSSHSESIGMVTIEALLSEVPVIGTNSGGTIENLENGKWGGLFEADNATALANELRKVFANYPEAQHKAREAKNVISKQYSKSHWKETIEHVFAQLV
jgi:glycosyltransferase involved in cell wall biosynthesis